MVFLEETYTRENFLSLKLHFSKSKRNQCTQRQETLGKTHDQVNTEQVSETKNFRLKV